MTKRVMMLTKMMMMLMPCFTWCQGEQCCAICFEHHKLGLMKPAGQEYDGDGDGDFSLSPIFSLFHYCPSSRADFWSQHYLMNQGVHQPFSCRHFNQFCGNGQDMEILLRVPCVGVKVLLDLIGFLRVLATFTREVWLNVFFFHMYLFLHTPNK